MSIQITCTEKSVSVKAPYHPTFVSRVKKLNGKWNGATSTWTVDIRDADRVREICREVYGTTGDDKPALVDIQIKLDDVSDDSLFDYGRMIAQRRSRDDRVKLGEGVIVVEGFFPGSAGSRANPKLGGTVTLEVRDVPECLVDDDCTVVRRHPTAIEQAQAQDTQATPDRPLIGMADAEFEQLAAVVAYERHARGTRTLVLPDERIPQATYHADLEAERPFFGLTVKDIDHMLELLLQEKARRMPANGAPAAMGEGDDLAGSAIRAEMAMAYEDDED